MTSTVLRPLTGFLAASLLIHGAALLWLHPLHGALSGSGTAAPVDITLVSTPSGAGLARTTAHRAMKKPMRQPPAHARPVTPHQIRGPAKHQITRRHRAHRLPAKHIAGTWAPRPNRRTTVRRSAHAQPLASAPGKLTPASNSAPRSGPLPAVHPDPSGSHTVSGGTLTLRLQRVLRARLTHYFRYPALARRRGWQGRVILSLSINARGQLSHLRIAQSSGYPVLDRAALHSLRQVGCLPRAAAWVGGRDVNVELPVRYRLVNS